MRDRICRTAKGVGLAWGRDQVLQVHALFCLEIAAWRQPCDCLSRASPFRGGLLHSGTRVNLAPYFFGGWRFG